MRVLITGGAGFIGSHLMRTLCWNGAMKSTSWTIFRQEASRTSGICARIRGFTTRSRAFMSLPQSPSLSTSATLCFTWRRRLACRLIVESPVRTIETNVARRPRSYSSSRPTRRKRKYWWRRPPRSTACRTQVPFREDGNLRAASPTSKGRWSYACSKAIDEFLGACLLARAEAAHGDRSAI